METACPYYVWLRGGAAIAPGSARCRAVRREGRRLCVGCPAVDPKAGGPAEAEEPEPNLNLGAWPETAVAEIAEIPPAETAVAERETTVKPETLGEALTRVRKENGLSQAKAAEAAGVNVFALGRWERGQLRPSLDEARALDKLYASDLAERYADVLSAVKTRQRRSISAAVPETEQAEAKSVEAEYDEGEAWEDEPWICEIHPPAAVEQPPVPERAHEPAAAPNKPAAIAVKAVEKKRQPEPSDESGLPSAKIARSLPTAGRLEERIRELEKSVRKWRRKARDQDVFMRLSAAGAKALLAEKDEIIGRLKARLAGK